MLQAEDRQTNDMSRVDLTVKNERRRVVAVLFSKDSEGVLIISGIIKIRSRTCA